MVVRLEALTQEESRRLQVVSGRGVKALMAGEGSSLKDGRQSLRERVQNRLG